MDSILNLATTEDVLELERDNNFTFSASRNAMPAISASVKSAVSKLSGTYEELCALVDKIDLTTGTEYLFASNAHSGEKAAIIQNTLLSCLKFPPECLRALKPPAGDFGLGKILDNVNAHVRVGTKKAYTRLEHASIVNSLPLCIQIEESDFHRGAFVGINSWSRIEDFEGFLPIGLEFEENCGDPEEFLVLAQKEPEFLTREREFSNDGDYNTEDGSEFKFESEEQQIEQVEIVKSRFTRKRNKIIHGNKIYAAMSDTSEAPSLGEFFPGQ